MTSVVIRHRDVSIELTEGDEVVLGRSSPVVPVGAAHRDGTPKDLGVSRRAATVMVRESRVWVRNDSASQPVYLVPEVGSTRILEHRDEIVSFPDSTLTVQLRGRIRTHDVTLEISGSVAEEPPGEPETTGEEPPTQHLLVLSQAERRILTALAEPLLVERGDRSRPASYAEAAERAYLSRSRVENCVSDLIRRFGGLGIPGLEGPEAKDNLCRYAVRSGSITAEDLDLIDPDGP